MPANQYFDWPASASRFVRFDTVRAADGNAALDLVTGGMTAVAADVLRAIKLPVGTAVDQVITLTALQRSNRLMSFDVSGNLTAILGAFNYRGDWATATAYVARDTFRDATTKNIYFVAIDHTSGVLATDIAAGRDVLSINVADVDAARVLAQTAATNSAGSATSSATSATASAASATAAASSATAAATSSGTAATQATNAAASATGAATSATNAASSATNAATSATNSSNSATAAAASAASIAGGPVASVGGATGIVVLKTVNGVALTGAGDITISANGSATETTSAVDIVLTSASTRVQAVSMTASSKSITLPSALTLTTGGALFIIKNTGFNKFPVRNSAGALLTVILPGQIAGFYLSNNTTVAGVWAIGNQSGSALEGIFAGVILSVNSVSSNWVSVTALSATQAIIAYMGASSQLQTCTLNISGTTITAGAIIVVDTNTVSYVSVTKLTATQAVVVYARSTDTVARTLNVSGTAVTAGAALSFLAATSTYLSVSALSATQAVVVDAGVGVEACTLNVSGTTVTNGTVLTIAAITGSFTVVSALSATLAIVVYNDGTGQSFVAQTISVSGTTLTANTALTITTGSGGGHMSVAALSATQAVAVYSANLLQACTLNISGTAVTAGPLVTVNPATSQKTSVAMLSATRAIVSYTGAIGGTQSVQSRILNISGTAVSANDAVVIDSQALNVTSITMLSANLALVGYAGISNFVKAATLEPAL